jgi:hypothetical protein
MAHAGTVEILEFFASSLGAISFDGCEQVDELID